MNSLPLRVINKAVNQQKPNEEQEPNWGDFEYLRKRLIRRAKDYEPIKKMKEEQENVYYRSKWMKMLKKFNDPLEYLSILPEYCKYK